MLLHSLQAFRKAIPGIKLVLVMPSEWFGYWDEMSRKQGLDYDIDLVAGGPQRFHSVKNGLKKISGNGLVAIHDAARPLVSLETISRVFHFAARFGSAIPVVEPADSIREVHHALSRPLERKSIRLVQTPQCFDAARLRNAYNSNYSEKFTDDATVYEAAGERLFLVEGNSENFKITTSADLLMADALLSKGNVAVR